MLAPLSKPTTNAAAFVHGFCDYVDGKPYTNPHAEHTTGRAEYLDGYKAARRAHPPAGAR